MYVIKGNDILKCMDGIFPYDKMNVNDKGLLVIL